MPPRLDKDGEHGTPMRHGAEENEYVPYGMEVLLLVVGKEVSASCIEESFSQQEEQRNCGEFLHHPGEDEEHAPPHRQVKYQG